MNYIWAGLIILSLVFALVRDIQDLSSDTYANDSAVPVQLEIPDGYAPDARRQPVRVTISPDVLQRLYHVSIDQPIAYDGTLIQTKDGNQIRFADGASLPEPLNTIRSFTNKRTEDLSGVVSGFRLSGDSLALAAITFSPVRFVNMNAIAEAALDFAETAVTIAISLIGVLALWLGLMRIAEKSGMIYGLVRLIQPILRPLFPSIPKGHPAMGMIILNMAANILGLGNAATPMGIKAMEELQTLNKSDDTATNDMVTFLAMNTSSVQLLPPATLVAIMGLQINQLFFTIILATLISTIVAILAAKTLQRMPRFRKTDPGTHNGEMVTEPVPVS